MAITHETSQRNYKVFIAMRINLRSMFLKVLNYFGKLVIKAELDYLTQLYQIMVQVRSVGWFPTRTS